MRRKNNAAAVTADEVPSSRLEIRAAKMTLFKPTFTIGLAQVKPRLGDVPHNLAMHLDYIARAKAAGADLVVFPELGLTGYFLRDLVATVAIHPTRDDATFAQLLEASRDLDILFSFVAEEARHRFTIAAAYLAQGELVHLHHKVYLPTYRLFDDARYFATGAAFRAFDTRLGRMGLLICEDAWHPSAAYCLWMDGADILFQISSSPGYGISASEPTIGNAVSVQRFNQVYAELFTVYMVHVNRVGVEDGVSFWGGSTVAAPDGRLIAEAPLFEEALLTATVERAVLRRVRAKLPMLRDERLEVTLKELERISQYQKHS